MEDETVLIVNKNVPTGYSTTMRSWMKPGDVEYFEQPQVLSIGDPNGSISDSMAIPKAKPTEPKPVKRKVKK